ncbi:hypothetical protein ACFLSZ_03610 [Candidatus Bipolaricaulota bacterium]
MRICILEEHGYSSALLGLSLSYNQDPEHMPAVAAKLRFKGEGHNKFLETIVVWVDIVAPRYFWQQFDTYRIGVTKQSESTMHTMTGQPLQQDAFEHPIPDAHLQHLNTLIAGKQWEAVKHDLPESFLQRRVVCLNYMILQRMIRQRRSHRLAEWRTFIEEVLRQIEHPDLLDEGACE